MKIVLAGASGFLGTPLRAALATEGHTLVQLVRGDPQRADQSQWDPYNAHVDTELVASADVVVNLAGVPIARIPMTESYKRQIVESRVATTSCLADTIAAVGGTTALVNAGGINYYGVDCGDETLDETSPAGTGFLSEVAQQWEAATATARDSGARVAQLRTAIVLDRSGGSFRLMALPFRFGVGGRIGSGAQWFPTISLADYVSAATRIVTDDSMHGPYNMTAEVPSTNAQFTDELGRQLRRPTFLTVPRFAVTTVVGELGKAMLGSVKATPQRLLDAGFTFAHPTIGDQVRAALD